MFIVYAIYNQKHDKFYIGQTRNLQERFQLHHEHTFNGYTSRFDGEWILIYSENNIETRKNAIVREKQLKSYQSRKFIKKYIPR